MSHIIKFDFPDSGYSAPMLTCSHHGDRVIELASKSWNDVGGCRFPFQQGKGLERPINESEIEVLRKLFTSQVERFKPIAPSDPRFNPEEDSVEDYEEYVKNGNQFSDKVFLELANLGTRWDTGFVVEIVFILAKIQDPTLVFAKIENYSTIDLF
jgi:hypothetical protein